MYVTAYVGLLNIGIGDVMAYSLLISVAHLLLRRADLVGMVFVSVVLGLISTLWLMRKMRLKYAPGLPLPLALGLVLTAILRTLL